MKNIARKKTKTNVLEISKHARYEKRSTKIAFVPEDYIHQLKAHTLEHRFFGFPKGSTVFYRENFNDEELTTVSIVITQNIDGVNVIAAGFNYETIVGVVDFIQIDLREAQ